MDFRLPKRHFLKLLDFSQDEISSLIRLAMTLKQAKKEGQEPRFLQRKNIALIFEKASTRTRCAFEVASHDQGANVTCITGDSQMGEKESIRDTARVLGRMYDGIEFRGHDHEHVETLAKYSGVPVWNGLTDQWHPTQVLADFITMLEHSNGQPLSNLSLCYAGDGRNNVTNSLLVGSAIMGLDFRIAAPVGHTPDPQLLNQCLSMAETSGANITVTQSIEEAVHSVNFIYTDVWVSMGEPVSAWEERIALMRPYQINQSVLDQTGNKSVRFLHCLPAFHNEETTVGFDIAQRFGLSGLEVTEDVFESDCSVVFDQAENRIHTIKAIMVATLGAYQT